MNTVSKRILCMEADDDSRELLSIILNRVGFVVVESKTIAEAIHIASKEHFDLHLVSGDFPDGGGIDFVRQARSFSRDIPIVLISGWAQNKYINEGLEAGASIYLIKPVGNDNIIQAVKSLIDPGASNTW